MLMMPGCGSSATTPGPEPAPPQPAPEAGQPELAPAADNRFRLCNSGEPSTIDPAHATSTTTTPVVDALFDGLMTADQVGAPVPSLARRWESNADHTVWTFHLRDDARWSSGRPITSADFVYSLRRLLDPATRAPNTDAAWKLVNGRAFSEGKVGWDAVGVEAPDPHTLRLRLRHPVQGFLYLAMAKGMRPVPREAIERHGKAWTRPDNIVTSGPFHLRSWAPRDRLELVRSPTFWDRANVGVDAMTIRSIPDQAANLALFRAGECDVTSANNVPNTYIGAELARPPSERTLETYPYLGTYLVLVNITKFPNVHLRRALAHAVDRDAVVATLGGAHAPTAAITPSLVFGDLSPADEQRCKGRRGALLPRVDGCYQVPPGLGFDPEAARRELGLARKQMGELPRSVSYAYNSGVPGHRLIAEELERQWERTLGIEVRLEEVEWKQFLYRTSRGDYELARMGWILNAPLVNTELLPQFRCGAPDNRARFCHPEFEKVMDAAARATTPDALDRHTHRAESLVLEQAAVIPIYVYAQHRLRRPWVKGWSQNLAGAPNPRWVRIERPSP